MSGNPTACSQTGGPHLATFRVIMALTLQLNDGPQRSGSRGRQHHALRYIGAYSESSFILESIQFIWKSICSAQAHSPYSTVLVGFSGTNGLVFIVTVSLQAVQPLAKSSKRWLLSVRRRLASFVCEDPQPRCSPNLPPMGLPKAQRRESLIGHALPFSYLMSDMSHPTIQTRIRE